CVVQGETEEEIMKNAAEHAVKDHGYKEEEIVNPEMKEELNHTYANLSYHNHLFGQNFVLDS
ncbi:MAG: DUF1059 domain-containing protein, partial [Nitrososphaeraceae archaeon]|nr:DUF1059 domain-containing protein [Nitrososphaeraceae archaeon]